MVGVNVWHFVIFLVCLLGAAFFCSAETAFIGMQKLRLQHLIRSDDPRAKAVARIVGQPERFLATVLLGVNLLETAVATLGTLIAVSVWGQQAGAAAAVAIITVVTLVFAELVPKSFGARHGEKIALLYARPILVISAALFPFVYVLNRVGVGLVGPAEEEQARPTISEEELATAISVGEAEGLWAEHEAEMLQKALAFADRPVKEVMLPRTEVVWVEQGTSLASFLDIYRQHPYSRFPVYSGTIDNVVGLLGIKDVLMAHADGLLDTSAPIDNLIRPVHFVPETKPLGELLSEMQHNNYHMVVVIDEFGGVAGMITLQQLSAEVVGLVGDELIQKQKDIVAIGANTFELDGGLRIEEANAELGLGLPSGDYETMAGFILSHLGRIPMQGEHFKYRDLKLAILVMRGKKIERVQVTREVNTPPVAGGGPANAG